MPNKAKVSVENNFTKGLITEFTGLNFPVNAATDCDNVEFTLIGNVLRRLGMDKEDHGVLTSVDTTNKAINTYKWNNAGGDGVSQVMVVAVGSTLAFYTVNLATTTNPLSTQYQGSLNILTNYPAGTTMDATLPVEFTDGNGYLFGFHPSIDPFYVSYVAGVGPTIIPITVQIRDFTGVPEPSIPDNARPSALTDSHKYNLQNQGWVSQTPWTTTSTTNISPFSTGSKAFTVPAGIPGLAVSQYVYIQAASTSGAFIPVWTYGTITSYVGTTLTINVLTWANSYGFGAWPGGNPQGYWYIAPVSTGYINTFVGALGVYPSNADQWWRFKTAANVFDPAATNVNISVGLGAAPKGHYLLNAFDQQRDQVSGVLTITDITTTKRPTNGCWFQGRVWYTGVNASQAATGTAPFTTWSENIYFSQVVQKTEDFGKCYQVNDPTTEELNSILPTDGGVLVIPGSGPIYRLFPIVNGLLVFAGNGVWFVTGSQGIGFAANDYTVTPLSNIKSISSTSFVNVMGLPYFWNEEGIYQVKPSDKGGLSVDPITVGTILSFYESIPQESKRFVRGDYHPIDYTIQWIYRSTVAANTTQRYSFDKILNFNVYNTAFYPYTIDKTVAQVKGINYVAGTGGVTSTVPAFKYFYSVSTTSSFAELWKETYQDWGSVNYTSYFLTGYRVQGGGLTKFQMPIVNLYSQGTGEYFAYKIQGVWDYALSGDTGRWSTTQLVQNDGEDYGFFAAQRRIRGNGRSLQLKVTSVDGVPFNLIGWATLETINQAP